MNVFHHFMLLLHLCNLLGVLLVHLLQLSHDSFTALAQSLFIIDQLKSKKKADFKLGQKEEESL